MNDIKSGFDDIMKSMMVKKKEDADKLGMTIDEYDKYLEEEDKKEMLRIDNEAREKYLNGLINRSIPEIYRNADIKNIDKRIIDFKSNKKNFCWISGKAGTGKTYSLYAISIDMIKKFKDYRSSLSIVKEYNIKYEDGEQKNIDAIDDFGLSKNENRNKYLLDWYFVLFDFILENNRKLYITSNLSINEWIKEMKLINDDTAMRIASRLSNVTDIIELTGNDRRKTNV